MTRDANELEHNRLMRYMGRNPQDFEGRSGLLPALIGRAAELIGVRQSPGIRLIDISRYQSWMTAAHVQALCNAQNAGHIDGVIIKATQGLTIVDPFFSTHYPRFLGEGCPVKTYHYNEANKSGAEQANFHLETILPLIDAQGGVVCYLDIEEKDGVANSIRANRAYDWLSFILLSGFESGYYSSPSLWRELMYVNNQPPVWANDFWQWVAHWTSGTFTPLGGGSVAKTVMHQNGIANVHSWIPALPGGITNPVDNNIGFWASRDELRQFMGLEEQPPTDPGCGCEEELALLDERLTKIEQERIPLGVRMYNAEEAIDALAERVKRLEEGGLPPPPPEPEPDPWMQMIVTDEDKTLARYNSGLNGKGFPIMKIYGDTTAERFRWDTGDTLLVFGPLIKCDNNTYYWQLWPYQTDAHGRTVPEEPKLYVNNADLTAQI